MSSKERPADELEMMEDDGNEDWEDERKCDAKLILDTAEKVNRLLLALLRHPEFVSSSPTESPMPLFGTADLSGKRMSSTLCRSFHSSALIGRHAS